MHFHATITSKKRAVHAFGPITPILHLNGEDPGDPYGPQEQQAGWPAEAGRVAWAIKSAAK